jgi:tartrate-resistant acid phosphatase type 5
MRLILVVAILLATLSIPACQKSALVEHALIPGASAEATPVEPLAAPSPENHEPLRPTPVPTTIVVSTRTRPPAPEPSQTAGLKPSPTPSAITFAAIGDYGWSGIGAREVAALVAEHDPDLVITLGDNNYPYGASWTIEKNITANYGRFIADGRFYPTLGNHDMTTDNGRPYFDYFDLPGNERYYDFVWEDIHFFAINSDWREADGISAGSAQATWLQEHLARSTSPWQVVYFHAPPFVSFAAKQVPAMDWPFADWGADLVLSGHAHLYERLENNGLTYIVNGLGGYTIYPFDEVPHPHSQVRYNDNFGALFVEVTAGALQGRFITRDGSVADSWTISKAGESD